MWRRKKASADDKKIGSHVIACARHDKSKKKLLSVLKKFSGRITIVIAQRRYNWERSGGWVFYWNIDAASVAGALKGFTFSRAEHQFYLISIICADEICATWEVNELDAFALAARIPGVAEAFFLKHKHD